MVAPLQRPDLYVVTRILEAVHRSDRPLRRTQLQLASGVNYTQFGRYLEFLEQRQLLKTVTDGGGVLLVELTPRGYELLVFIGKGLRDLLGEVDRRSAAPKPDGQPE